MKIKDLCFEIIHKCPNNCMCCSSESDFVKPIIPALLAEYTASQLPPSIPKIDETLIIKNPESYYNEQYIKKAIDRFVHDPSSRYNKIEVPTNSPTPKYLVFQGRYTDDK